MWKKRLFQLDARLAACAALVREDCKLADIGTDHGYLPIYLAKQGKVRRAIAADVRVGPLQRAAMHVRKYHAEDLVQTRLSDGLEVIFPNEADDVVIAGMGGELIAEIIGKASWLRDPEKHLILQPMTAAVELRRYLREAGFSVREETAVSDGEKVYSAMLAVFDPAHPNTETLFPYVGLVSGATPAGRAYIERQIRFYEKKAAGLSSAGETEQAAPYRELTAQLREYLEETGGGNHDDSARH